MHNAAKNKHNVKSFDSKTKWMKFLIKGAELLKKYTNIWIKVSIDIKIELDFKPIYIKSFWKPKYTVIKLQTFIAKNVNTI